MTPFFSVILPVYNRATFIPTAVESVLAQTFTQWELIIIDDGSTDNTREVVRQYENHPGVRYIFQENQERSAARNHGIAQARGRFICFLDSDDFYLPNHLEVLHTAIQSHAEKPALYYTAYYVEINGNRRRNKSFSAMKNGGLYNIMFEELLQTNSVCIAASLLAEDRFPVQFNLFEDNHLWMRVIARSEMIYIDTPTNVVIDHEARSLKVDAGKLKAKWKKYEDILIHLLWSGNYPLLDSRIAWHDKTTFMALKALVMAFEALKTGSLSTTYFFLFASLRYRFIPGKTMKYIKLFAGAPFYILLQKIKSRRKA